MPVLQQLGRLLRFARRLPAADAVALACWGTILLIVELAGRLSTSDLGDALLLGSLLVLTGAVHSVRELKPVTWLLRVPRQWLRTFLVPTVELGVDLRRSPPIRRGFPSAWPRGVLLLSVSALGILALLPRVPGALREWLSAHAYLPYLVLLGLLWGGLIFATLLLTFFCWASIRDWLVMSHQGQGSRPRRTETLLVLAVVGMLLLAANLLPAWVPLLFIAGALGAVSVTLPLCGSGLTLLWRRPGEDEIETFDGRWFLWFHWTVLILFTANLVLLSTGELVGRPHAIVESSTPATLVLGQILAWTAVPGLGLSVLNCARFAWLGICFNPRRDLERLPIGGESPPHSPDFRRWEIEQRRQVVRGLKRLFKRAARVSRGRGTGIWIGVQHWFVLGLTRDASEDDDEKTVLEDLIGPPYHRLFSRESRLHYWQVTEALKVDLILVEDGVTFQRFVRVLRMMFEIYDVFGGRQCAEELHFSGLPGVRVVIHEFGMGGSESLGKEGYPEPDYNEIGRARILHVFKDRGEHEELDPLPSDFEGVPVLSGV